MGAMQSEVFEAFRPMDVPEDKALRAAQALSRRDNDVSVLKTDMAMVKWMLSFVLAFQVANFVKLFVH